MVGGGGGWRWWVKAVGESGGCEKIRGVEMLMKGEESVKIRDGEVGKGREGMLGGDMEI